MSLVASTSRLRECPLECEHCQITSETTLMLEAFQKRSLSSFWQTPSAKFQMRSECAMLSSLPFVDNGPRFELFQCGQK